MRVARQYRFTGDVQGVGFRWTAKRIADGLRVDGWVRNDSDGAVSLALEGEAGEVDRFLSALDDAMGGNISHIESRDETPGKNRDGFDVVR